MEYLVDTSLKLLAAGAYTTEALGITPYGTGAMVTAGGDAIVNSLAALSNLISQASGNGNFSTVYSDQTGGDFTQDVGQFYAAIPTSTPDQTFVACERLADDIKKALVALHARDSEILPYACGAGGVRSQCSEAFINTTKENLKKLLEEIEELVCKVNGKKFEKRVLELTLEACAQQLDAADTTCKTTAQSTCATPPAIAPTTCGCAPVPVPVVPEPVEETTCVLVKKPKKKTVKPKKRKLVIDPPPQTYEYWDYGDGGDMYADYGYGDYNGGYPYY